MVLKSILNFKHTEVKSDSNQRDPKKIYENINKLSLEQLTTEELEEITLFTFNTLTKSAGIFGDASVLLPIVLSEQQKRLVNQQTINSNKQAHISKWVSWISIGISICALLAVVYFSIQDNRGDISWKDAQDLLFQIQAELIESQTRIIQDQNELLSTQSTLLQEIKTVISESEE